MSGKIDDLIPSATELRKQASIKETEKAEERLRWMAAADAEKRALIEKLSKPSGFPEDKKIELASTVIQRAVRNGLKEVQVYRFPNSLVHRPWPRHQSARRCVGAQRYPVAPRGRLADSSGEARRTSAMRPPPP
jgi:hypothetical protein